MCAEAINTHISFKSSSRKQKRLQSKPLLTKGLLVSIKKKQKLYLTPFKTDVLAKKKKQFYKIYANKLNKLKLKAKTMYDFNQFKKYSNNSQKTRSLISSLLHSRSESFYAPLKLYLNERETTNPVELINFCIPTFPKLEQKRAKT